MQSLSGLHLLEFLRKAGKGHALQLQFDLLHMAGERLGRYVVDTQIESLDSSRCVAQCSALDHRCKNLESVDTQATCSG